MSNQALDDEEAIPSSSANAPNVAGEDGEDDGSNDFAVDYRFMHMKKIPKRGEKDFEEHGTRAQLSVLEASRQAMHDAISGDRIHADSKNSVRAWYFGEEVFNGDEVERQALMSERVRGRGLEKDRIVMLESMSGTHYRTMGKAAQGTEAGRGWLLPEEALYLLERGNIDLWWPHSHATAQILAGDWIKYGYDDDKSFDQGVPMSLQAAYSLLIGEGEGKTSLEEFTVFANLKRAGFVVNRHQPPPPAPEPEVSSSWDWLPSYPSFEGKPGLLGWLFPNLITSATSTSTSPQYGPLANKRYYRNYASLYPSLSIVPLHKPTATPPLNPPPEDSPFKLSFDIYKPSRIPTFAKSHPGPPDFRICVVDADDTSAPTLEELTALLESTPFDPPNPGGGDAKSFARLKHGWRNVILAVLDGGIISYLNMSEGAFGEEKLWERFDRGNVVRGGKGGGRGRGGFRGRGRGRGRGK